MEAKQRATRKERAAQGLPLCTARWFEQISARHDEELPRWRYKGGYWEAREQGTWVEVPDIHGSASSDAASSSFPGKAAVLIS